MGISTHVGDDGVAVITWNDGENRLNPDSLDALFAVVEDLERREGPLAVVLSGEGKFFSNGLDLERFRDNPAEFRPTLEALQQFIGRLLVFPAYTVAAINGHAFAGGALLTMAFDYRVMRADRGYWCMNEAEIGLPLDQMLFSIIEHRLPRAVAVEAALTARRYPGPVAQELGIVEEIAPEDAVLARARERAASMVHLDRSVMRTHKRLMHDAQAAHLGYLG